MYVFGYDRETSTLVGAKIGEPCTDSDYESIVESTTRLVVDAPANALACFVLVIDPGQPPPSPVWRKRLAQARAPSKAFRIVIVSSSIVERGIVTAIHWLRPPAPGQKVVSRATFEEAVAWLEAEGGPRPILHALYADLQDPASWVGTGSFRSEARSRANLPVDNRPLP
jgi:hypothetical protein